MKIIAEIGWNFLGDMDLAYEMIDKAKQSGANVVKFQYWDPGFLSAGPWDNDGRKEIYNKAALDESKINDLSNYSKKIKIDCLFSVFTLKAAKLIKSLDHKIIKIPSHEISNYKLLEYVSENFAEVLVSTGASYENEILKVISIMNKGKANYNLMHCVSSYPCTEENINLPRLNWLKILHNKIGFSDHTKSTLTPSIAVSLGAEIIEKHFTSDNSLPGRDNKFALNPLEFKEMTKNISETLKMLNYHGNNAQESENEIISLYRGRWGKDDYE